LIRLLRQRDIEIFGTRLGSGGEAEAGVQMIECDLRNSAEVARVVKESSPSQVFHLAALSSVQDSFDSGSEIYDVNFRGTRHLLEAVRTHAPGARMLLVGSAQIYGAVRTRRAISENAPLMPQSPYAVSKAAADLLGIYYWKRFGMQVMRARPFNHTGPGQAPNFVCSDFARQVAAISKGISAAVMSVGKLEIRRDFSDVRDVVRAYCMLVEKGQSGAAYNVCSGRTSSIREILQILFKFAGTPIQTKVESVRVRAAEIEYLCGSNSLLRRHTGWKPQIKLEQTLKDLFVYWSDALNDQGQRFLQAAR
jgi:GDP-4-dehydro-6-deoxy-D-mannose reductase